MSPAAVNSSRTIRSSPSPDRNLRCNHWPNRNADFGDSWPVDRTFNSDANRSAIRSENSGALISRLASVARLSGEPSSRNERISAGVGSRPAASIVIRRRNVSSSHTAPGAIRNRRSSAFTATSIGCVAS